MSGSLARTTAEAYVDAVNAVDLDGLVALFAEDALLDHTFGTFEGIAAIRTFFRWAKARGYVTADPAERLGHPKGGTRLPSVLRPAEAASLVEAPQAVPDPVPTEPEAFALRDRAVLGRELHADSDRVLLSSNPGHVSRR